jgi:type IV pilus assembly protein PilB
MVDPTDIFAIDDIKFMTGYDVEPMIALEGAVSAALAKYYDSSRQLQTVLKDIETQEEEVKLDDKEEEVDVSKLKEAVEDAPVVKLANFILTEAIKRSKRYSTSRPTNTSFESGIGWMVPFMR